MLHLLMRVEEEKGTMKTFNLLSVLMVAGMLSACGSSSTRDYTLDSSGLTNTNSGTNSGNWQNLPAAPSWQGALYGQGTTYTYGPNSMVSPNSYYTSAQLKVKIVPLAAPNSPGGAGTFNFPYGCVSFSVKVNGHEIPTGVIRVAGVTQGANSQCATAPTSAVLDFSTYLTGAGSVTVTVSDPMYDNCRTASPGCYGASMRAPAPQHPVAFQAVVQPDGYYMDP
ncbi:MAG: hypothetical protein EBX52_05115 [Proteobacteria bacterium]|nr:hypothetical protein [Pseudomonadota bacterium]